MATTVLNLNFDLLFCDGIDEVYVTPISSYKSRYVYARVYFPASINEVEAKRILQEIKDEINEQSR
jgi:hypothetical protein